MTEEEFLKRLMYDGENFRREFLIDHCDEIMNYHLPNEEAINKLMAEKLLGFKGIKYT